ncbi:magnesium/cobalt transporter CorA [Planococcus shenhongbingii]|uniref:Magnesium transport protein CorA n=1 Tax=Planococcus shenhongbingii TaxID=3058398 RepID=A0ABT8N7S2_9BACL|nr:MULTISPECIES: magnesium/cobalt transporter CorA [unclassified Planococcus (in: firmicutes)]MDN7243928.1 magnesium/cobalt transporter CorA [Planococcus sp. N017]WKA57106.1 magnesium/cobalt transporter CorA [Planococcus sp. N016]
MIRIQAINQQDKMIINPPLEALKDMKWYWVDFIDPTDEEIGLLSSHFHFHPLAIEDCIHSLQRPKLEYYEDVNFLVFHSLNQETLEAEEIDVFIADNFIVSFHFEDLKEVNITWDFFSHPSKHHQFKPVEVTYKLMDKVVDSFFPLVEDLEDQLAAIEDTDRVKKADKNVMEKTFLVRRDLFKLRQIVIPTRDLVYRILESKRFILQEHKRAYFQDIHDHLIKLSHMIDSNRELTSDIRDNYISLNSYRMNNIMKTLTVITTIFMPLTFIAGIYGMNFNYMPELQWQGGYYAILTVMLLLGGGMFAWFYSKGWFDSE